MDMDDYTTIEAKWCYIVLFMNLYCRPCSTYLHVVGRKRVRAVMRMMLLLNSAHAVCMSYMYLGDGMGWGWYGQEY